MSNLAEQKNNYSSSTLCGIWFEDRAHEDDSFFPVCSNTMHMSTAKQQMMEGASSEFEQYGSRIPPVNKELDTKSMFSEKTWESQTQSMLKPKTGNRSTSSPRPNINLDEYRNKWTKGNNFNRDFRTTYSGFGSHFKG